MTDLEMTRLCAEAMGDDAWTDINGRWYCRVRGQETIFTPLTDDAQAMALVKKLGMHIHNDSETWWAMDGSGEYDSRDYTDLNRAICECVAKMQEAKNV